MGRFAARVARSLFGAVDRQLGAVVKGNGRHRRVRRLQRERVKYRREVDTQRGGKKR
ncbi:MAG: hypothetical protein GWN58_25600 [Anaerolineae bacterium]|nr:hypothetical protein [Anaerolineae bacterium]